MSLYRQFYSLTQKFYRTDFKKGRRKKSYFSGEKPCTRMGLCKQLKIAFMYSSRLISCCIQSVFKNQPCTFEKRITMRLIISYESLNSPLIFRSLHGKKIVNQFMDLLNLNQLFCDECPRCFSLSDFSLKKFHLFVYLSFLFFFIFLTFYLSS